ncbi:hypothetical protein GPY61_31940 [Massilia sp. NEAU-DD11]|uniref:Stability/partitioning determinant n=1 Tax=Massilia cellulosiltytica TaxID=2683234 RepID=A0A7X3KAY1_9BURK|nr:hypothetical protein [Telluria cellulosilytica]MVW64534.1 hypothetical protein [Telluria cellulosilytica]
MNERVNPFGDLGDFAPAPAKPKAEILEVVDQVAEQHGFPSRQPVKQTTPEAVPAPAAPAAPEQPAGQVLPKEQLPSRRRTTGRSEQVNIKTTFAAKKRLMEISVERDMPLGEILEQALAALEREWGTAT